MSKNKKMTLLATPTAQTLLALALLVAAVLASRGEEVVAWEHAVFIHIYTLPGFLFAFFYAVTQLGSVYMLAILPTIYAVKRRYHVALRLLLTGTLAYMAAGVAKDVWGRGRPADLLTDIASLDIIRGPGFPSGHMALATALALVLGHYLPKVYYGPLAGLIVLVGVSRIYLGVHMPLDIVGGFALGWFSYALFRHVRLLPVRQAHRTTAKRRKV